MAYSSGYLHNIVDADEVPAGGSSSEGGEQGGNGNGGGGIE